MTFLKEAAALVQNKAEAGGKKAAEITLCAQDELKQKVADADIT